MSAWTKFLKWYGETHAKEKFVIKRSWTDEDYLTRYTILGRRFSGKHNVFLHRFHRSDYDEPHDHPWPFTSIILAGGYWELTPRLRFMSTPTEPATLWEMQHGAVHSTVPNMRRTWYGPGRILVRPARWIHAVKIPEDGREVWSLVITGLKVRTWGFWCGPLWHEWRQWQAHFSRMMATGLSGCD